MLAVMIIGRQEKKAIKLKNKTIKLDADVASYAQRLSSCESINADLKRAKEALAFLGYRTAETARGVANGCNYCYDGWWPLMDALAYTVAAISIFSSVLACLCGTKAKPSPHPPTRASTRQIVLQPSALADRLTSQQAVNAFFDRRQTGDGGGQRKLSISCAWALQNEAALQKFKSSGQFDIDPNKAMGRSCDTLLYHGCGQEAATNIMAEGLKLTYAQSGMLGRGLYAAPDPRKSFNYCRHGSAGKFMFICRVNLARAQHAGPATTHRNTHFQEFCVYDESEIVVLWCLKVQ